MPELLGWLVHPHADGYPLMGGAEFAALVADIRANGLRQPVAMWRGKLLDGRNRVRACAELDIVPDVLLLDDDIDPIAFIESVNWHRRHLTAEQQASHVERRRALVRELADQGLSQREIAEAAGTSQPTVHRDLKTDSDESSRTSRPTERAARRLDALVRSVSKLDDFAALAESWDSGKRSEVFADLQQLADKVGAWLDHLRAIKGQI